ncbi:hypothetical protein [Streptomyces sp. NPDC002644]
MRPARFIRGLAATSAAGTLALAGALAVAAPAQGAALDLLACTVPSSETSTFSPALTNTNQPTSVHVTTQYRNCLAPTEPTLTSGDRSGSFTRDTSCVDLLGGGTRTFTITWNDGSTSTITGQSVANIAGAVLTSTLTGTVTHGQFQGGTVVQQVVSPALAVLPCTLGAGTVSRLDSTVTLVITQL